MASSGGKKGKKKQWKQVALDDIIESSSTTRKFTWADEVDRELDVDSCDYPNKSQNVVLPTAPRASRGTYIDETKIPTSGPFQAYVSNLNFEITESELANFFKDLKIKSVRIPKEERGGRPTRGFGYIEFEDRASLIAALNQSDAMVKGRQIHIELATNNDGGGRGGGSRGGRGSRDGPRDALGPDRTSMNWRSGSRTDDFDDRFDRGQYGGGRRDFGGSGFSRYERDDHSSFGGRSDRGGFGREDRFQRDDRGSSSFGREDRDGGFGQNDRFGDRNYERGGGAFRDRGSFRDDERDRRDDRFARSDERRDRDGKYGPPPPRREGPPTGEPKSRTKLQLKPRSDTIEQHDAAPTNQSIFGGAKPVDTSARDREIEERLAKTNEELGRSGPSGREKGGDWSEDKRVEPAPPPKENAWSRKGNPPPPINNGRSSPDEDVHSESLQQDEGDEIDDEKRIPHSEPKRLEPKRSGT